MEHDEMDIVARLLAEHTNLLPSHCERVAAIIVTALEENEEKEDMNGKEGAIAPTNFVPDSPAPHAD